MRDGLAQIAGSAPAVAPGLLLASSLAVFCVSGWEAPEATSHMAILKNLGPQYIDMKIVGPYYKET